MTDFREIVRTIQDPKAPPRLRGRAVRVCLDPKNHKLEFKCDIPDDPTANEVGYLKWAIGELVDELREKFPGLIGEIAHAEVRPSPAPEEPR